jgi:hypothetical protein
LLQASTKSGPTGESRRGSRTIQLRFCELDWIDGFGAMTRFPVGSRWGAHPHDSGHYWHLAYAYGHMGDVFAYAQHHELAHHLVSEGLGSHSLVLWSLAHGEKPSPMVAAAEEALAMALHRFAMTNQPPFIDGVDWVPLRERFLELSTRAGEPSL